VARIMLPLALAGLTLPSLLHLLLVFTAVNIVVYVRIPIDVDINITSVPV
jgi:hypothetical protein